MYHSFNFSLQEIVLFRCLIRHRYQTVTEAKLEPTQKHPKNECCSKADKKYIKKFKSVVDVLLKTNHTSANYPDVTVICGNFQVHKTDLLGHCCYFPREVQISDKNLTVGVVVFVDVVSVFCNVGPQKMFLLGLMRTCLISVKAQC